jgi:hygromycin-B 7''-O-kinase
VSPAVVAARVRDDLRLVEEGPVPLHSNPGPEHVFVDPVTLRQTGVIDFADAYLSHPALDLRRWGQPADREAVIAGYSAAGMPLSESFHANWRAISVAALMQDFATRPSRRSESLDALLALVGSA